MRRALAFLCAVGIICAGMEAVAQETDTYQETVYPLAKSEHERYGLKGPFVRPGGEVDYFVSTSEEQDMEPRQFHSGDGGKTWREVPMDWHRQAAKQYRAAAKRVSERAGEIYGGGIGAAGSIYMAGNGDIYCMMEIGAKSVDLGDRISGVQVSKILKVSNGTAAEIPNLTLGDQVQTGEGGSGEWEAPEYQIAGTDGKGGLAIVSKSYNAQQNAYTDTILTYDVATGKLKSKTSSPVPKAQYKHYACGVVYAVNYLAEGGKWDFVAYDAETGKLLRSLPYPAPSTKSDHMQAVSVCAGDDGTVFVTSTGGLYRLDPEKDTFVKLLDGAACRLKTNALCNPRAACTADGKVYIPIRYIKYGAANLDHSAKTQGRLYCYIPK